MYHADELDEYERAVAKALAHDGGAAILDLARAGRSAHAGRAVERAGGQFRLPRRRVKALALQCERYADM
jgi:hypothetical protein